jgi:hypothetical protein
LDFASPSFSRQERTIQIINTVTASLRLEDDVMVKKEMLRLLVSLGEKSLIPLKIVRMDLITLLKNQGTHELDSYWNNYRETLFYVALAISKLENTHPTFRCFPFKQLKIRQLVLPDGADFEGATLAYAELWGGKMHNAHFRNANLYHVVIRDIDIQGASFESAELQDASIGPNVQGLNPKAFKNANWRRAKKILPKSFQDKLMKEFPTAGEVRAGLDRDMLCSKVLNEEYQIK